MFGKVSILWIVFILGVSAHASGTLSDSLMIKLDQTIENRPLYIKRKLHQIDELKKRLHREISDEQRFSILGELLDEYHSYQTDSSLAVARFRYQVGVRLKKQEHIDDAKMNMAEILGTAGMYKEALDLMHTIQVAQLPDYLHPYYYHIYRIIYGLMSDYAVTVPEKKRYSDNADCYRDSLLSVNTKESLIYVLIECDQYNARGEYDKAIKRLSSFMETQMDDVHDRAIYAYTLSESYRLKGDTDNEKKYLILSSIADMKSAIREYVSLRKLAILLYNEGDIDRAYSYLNLCMDDAVLCNARLRILEILKIFPIINKTYQNREEAQQKQIKIALISISLLSLFLIIVTLYAFKQMRRVASARRELLEVNGKLSNLNEELYNFNNRLTDANRSIAENSYLKEEYIGRYMDQCSVYLEKMDTYRRSLVKMASSGKIEDLYKHIKSKKFIEDELKDFYANFDASFLQLFPTFVEQFNALLMEKEKIYPKGKECLNTELRIFALIRLGITDSVKIAQFLRYSVTTIYNYRTKVRNKASGERNQLEIEVMKIDRLKP